MTNLSETAKRRGFQIHAVAFVVGLPLQAAINVLTGPPYWVVWVAAAWSVGLLCHWYFVLGPGVRRN